MQEGFGDPANFGRHGRREEQRLTGEGDQFADAFDVGDEAHVEHAVGFVDHRKFDPGEQQHCRVRGVVEQSSGRRDQHVDTRISLLS